MKKIVLYEKKEVLRKNLNTNILIGKKKMNGELFIMAIYPV